MFTIEINEKLIELESASIFRETRTEIFQKSDSVFIEIIYILKDYNK